MAGMSEEHKRAIGDAMRGRVLSKRHRERIRRSLREHWAEMSAEERARHGEKIAEGIARRREQGS